MTWKNIVAISESRVNNLPKNINEDGAQILCEIESKLDGDMLGQQADLVKKAKRKRAKNEYLEIQYEISAIIGLSDLRFEVRFGNNVIGEGTRVPVVWQFRRTEVAVDWGNGGQYVPD